MKFNKLIDLYGKKNIAAVKHASERLKRIMFNLDMYPIPNVDLSSKKLMTFQTIMKWNANNWKVS